MIPAAPFFKQAETKQFNEGVGTRPFVGPPRFGFYRSFEPTIKPLPTAPAIVGGNVDWTKSRVTPATQYLHSVLAGGRPMEPPAALGSLLRLGEPTTHSIHTQY
jgi:hypothetical protein